MLRVFFGGGLYFISVSVFGGNSGSLKCRKPEEAVFKTIYSENSVSYLSI